MHDDLDQQNDRTQRQKLTNLYSWKEGQPFEKGVYSTALQIDWLGYEINVGFVNSKQQEREPSQRQLDMIRRFTSSDGKAWIEIFNKLFLEYCNGQDSQQFTDLHPPIKIGDLLESPTEKLPTFYRVLDLLIPKLESLNDEAEVCSITLDWTVFCLSLKRFPIETDQIRFGALA